VLELILSSGDAERSFRIERRWDVNVSERRVLRPLLTVSENGRPLDWLDQDSPEPLQDFLRSTFPPQIAPFFFFDGERIQEFAEENEQSQRMVEAIEDILHINVYKALRSDLRKYVIDYIEANEIRANGTDDFFTLQQDAERLTTEIEKKSDRQLEIDREIDEAQCERKRREDELRRIASPHASKRDELLAERQRLEQELDEAKADIQKGFESIPILLAGQLARRLEITLREEQGSVVTPEALRQLRQRVAEVEHRVFIAPDPPPAAAVLLNSGQLEFYRGTFRRVAEEIFDLKHEEPANRIHDIAEGERQRILTRLAAVAGAVQQRTVCDGTVATFQHFASCGRCELFSRS